METIQLNQTVRGKFIGTFIGTINAMMQEFYFVNPNILVKLINVYATSFYGSVLWNLYSPQVDKLYKAWKVTIRNIFGLPWKAHRNCVTAFIQRHSFL